MSWADLRIQAWGWEQAGKVLRLPSPRPFLDQAPTPGQWLNTNPKRPRPRGPGTSQHLVRDRLCAAVLACPGLSRVSTTCCCSSACLKSPQTSLGLHCHRPFRAMVSGSGFEDVGVLPDPPQASQCPRSAADLGCGGVWVSRGWLTLCFSGLTPPLWPHSVSATPQPQTLARGWFLQLEPSLKIKTTSSTPASAQRDSRQAFTARKGRY